MQHTSPVYIDPAFAAGREHGNPERAWDRHLRSGQEWQPAAGPLLVVGPHPRDVILGAGGLIHSWVSTGHDVTVFSVSDGEPDSAEGEHLDLLRRDELRGALRKLCATRVSVVRLGLHDGHVRASLNRLRLAIDALLEPGMTLIGPFEHDGHPENDAIGKVCRESAHANRVSLARYPLRSWSRSDPAGFGDVRWGKFSLDMEAHRAKTHALQCFDALHMGAMEAFQRSFEAFLL
jgi:LmbE family N-acetylglucosaminyl deacetylase